MGCDIHTFGEKKIGDKYEFVREFHMSRNYDMFTKLAGVRIRGSFVNPISNQRGLPEDASYFLRDQYQDSQDWHNAGWVDLKEFKLICDEFGYDYKKITEGIDRVVFWFDN